MRIRGTSTEEMEEEGLETDGMVESSSKLQSKIKGLSGVDILTDTGAYKSTYQISTDIPISSASKIHSLLLISIVPLEVSTTPSHLCGDQILI